ncbi:hypothetical protein CVT24_000232 [Panaeolus cyanescens]|uniref:Shieldin complex subunit 2 first OB fold domain-containing protein n=1 Tax=Panaeolus cyanescens TaxID=181874 RepID=A0A409VIH1_9AGAR|nr:hypothetical protein CVT24_000232 [Panaeolus cyanescens]
MTSYRVFLGAPTRAELANEAASYRWTTTSSGDKPSIPRTRTLPLTQSVVLPTATLEAASARISLIYKDLLFNDDSDDDGLGLADKADKSEEQEIENSVLPPAEGERTTVYTWPPTAEEGMKTNPLDKTHNLRLTNNVTAANMTMDTTGHTDPSFFKSLYTTKSFLSGEGDSIEYPRRDNDQTGVETQLFETQESQSFGNYSDASSIGRFPSYHFSLHSITSLGQLANSGFKGSKKINVLLAVLEVDGPDTIRIKKGVDAGREVSILKLILGDDAGQVCKLTAWREVAELWGGALTAIGTKRGDIVHIENVTVTCIPGSSMTLTASPNLQSQLTICYRTMPYTHEDGCLRPDLRLGEGEPTIRRVSAIVQWFEHIAGLV